MTDEQKAKATTLEVVQAMFQEFKNNHVVDSGFALREDDVNGIDTFTAIGSATITDDNANGLDILTF